MIATEEKKNTSGYIFIFNFMSEIFKMDYNYTLCHFLSYYYSKMKFKI